MRFMVFIALLSLSFHLKGQTDIGEIPNKKFMHYLDHSGMVLIESLEPGMTLYSLSKKYNVAIDSIFAANPDLDPHSIPLGYPVNIPIYSSSISLTPPPSTETTLSLYYRVQPKETLYRISKTYLDIGPEAITTLNPTVEQGLAIGQILLIGWYTPSAIKPPLAASTFSIYKDSAMTSPKDYIMEAHLEGTKVYEQKGLAVWKPGNMNAHYYVLHPTAKVGSYMEITNPMLKRTITAKVAGHIPPGLYQSNVGIVVSPSTARALGALDQQFYARWRYVE